MLVWPPTAQAQQTCQSAFETDAVLHNKAAVFFGRILLVAMQAFPCNSINAPAAGFASQRHSVLYSSEWLLQTLRGWKPCAHWQQQQKHHIWVVEVPYYSAMMQALLQTTLALCHAASAMVAVLHGATNVHSICVATYLLVLLQLVTY